MLTGAIAAALATLAALTVGKSRNPPKSWT